MNTPRTTGSNKTNKQAILVVCAILVITLGLTLLQLPVMAQSQNGSYSGSNGSTGSSISSNSDLTTLRDPLIQGALTTPDYQTPQVNQPPAPGSGTTPLPVTAGQPGSPIAPPSMVAIPSTTAMDQNQVNQAVAPSLTPPPSTLGVDPGIVQTITPGFIPPASVVNIIPTGGIQGTSAITHWNGQNTRDFGLVRTTKNPQASQTTDFGQEPNTLSTGGIMAAISQDGPLPATYPGQQGTSSNRQPNLPNATETQDLYGDRIPYKGTNLRARMTIAPF